MIETRAPGKLFILGEYAVVEPGEPAVLVAVDRYLRVRLTECAIAPIRHYSDHVLAAIQVIDELRTERGLPPRHFELEIESELDDESGLKFGLGSSAAVTVAVIEALDALYELQLGEVGRFKAALLATISLSPRASGGDIAASTFGGWILYTSPDREALRAHREQHGVTSALDCAAWDTFSQRALPAPRGVELLVGWTGSPASTEALVGQVASSEQSRAVQHERRNAFQAESRALVQAFVAGLEAGDERPGLAIRNARQLMQSLGSSRGILIETETLRILCDIAEQHGASAKPSGAGGGDCGIVLASTENDIPGILREWESAGIRHLPLKTHEPSHTPKG